jgi:ribulose-phosphate 3-epimerase
MPFRPLIAPSILSADFARLGEQVSEAEQHGADWLHVDVMDGRFVPPISMGQVVTATCRRITGLPLDVHLMVQQPEGMLASFAEAGADHITVHVEAVEQLNQTLQQIKDLGCIAGVSLKPITPVDAIESALALADMVLVMSVEPGYGGQAFMPEVLTKVRELRQKLNVVNPDALIVIDGGIDAQTLPAALEAGVNVFVAGSSIYGHPDGVAAGIKALRDASLQGQER